MSQPPLVHPPALHVPLPGRVRPTARVLHPARARGAQAAQAASMTKYTERQMLDYLHTRYSQTNPGNGPRWACAEHVKNQAGFFAGRSADFMAVDCWPGGGIELHGHEVKVSRSDWLRELKNPAKAEAFTKYVDRWWVVAPDTTIVKPDELPPGWGLITLVNHTVYSGRYAMPRTTEMRLRTRVQATRLEPDPLPREMLATLMRAAVRTTKRHSHSKFCTTDPCPHNPRWLA